MRRRFRPATVSAARGLEEDVSLGYNETTLEQVRQAVGAIKKADLGAKPADEALRLDSIDRIALLVELENRFQVELDGSTIMPESFESLASLARLVDMQRAGS